MRLTVDVNTNIRKLKIDYIMVKLKDGREVSLNWDSSGIDWGEDGKGFSACYRGVYFDEEYANGQIDALKDMEIGTIGLYSEDVTDEQMQDAGGLVVNHMEFEDGNAPLLEFDNVPYGDIDWTM